EAHLALRLRRGFEAFDAIGFGLEDPRALPEPGMAIDVAGTLERDDFQGMPRLRLRLLDWAEADASPLAARRASVIAPVISPAFAGAG
ncbi:MAG: hypothetical protein ACRDGV_10125, partial [Candidatus Limnocylindria bacterium]